ncbi:DNA adenine methylase [Plantibacter sp. YIM 135347]|uniref:DNA adenine methylase n=1 Tax=Plantibacter sp. YIM 135347 TaxID=3423919 RepID=UPI003D324AAD
MDTPSSIVSAPAPTPARPFLRWAGSKRLLLKQIEPHLPDTYSRYIEPFLGGGSLFLRLRPHNALLNDACAPLAATWNAVGQDPQLVHEYATRLELNEANYYAERPRSDGTPAEQAGRFIFLNSGAFGGIYRVNRAGGFNVPWGKPKTGHTVDLKNLEQVAHTLQKGQLQVQAEDFESLLADAGTGDLVFLDPPYVTTHNSNGFVDYNEKLFSWSDQERLASAAHSAAARGAYVVVTNADHPSVEALYEGFKLYKMSKSSTLAAVASKRKTVSELLMVGHPRLTRLK